MVELPITLLEFFILITASFAGSLLTAVAGVGGGSFLIVIMTGVLPPIALIPVHGAVQLGSNSFRFYLTKAHVDVKSVELFFVGSLMALVLGIVFVSSLNIDMIPLFVGGFIILTTWVNFPKLNLLHSSLGMLTGGLLTSFLTFFVGATGPLVAAWIGLNEADRLRYTANFSASMTCQHSIKIVLFILAGFYFTSWLLVILAMIAAGFVGTKIGVKRLKKTSSNTFKLVFKILLTLLSLRLFWNYYSF